MTCNVNIGTVTHTVCHRYTIIAALIYGHLAWDEYVKKRCMYFMSIIPNGIALPYDYWLIAERAVPYSVHFGIYKKIKFISPTCVFTKSSNETPTWCNTVQVLFLQSHSTCFVRKHPSSVVFKTSTAATGTCYRCRSVITTPY